MAAAQSTQDKPGFLARVKTFFRETNEETKRVTWPTKEKARVSVVIVLLFATMMAIGVGALDVILANIFNLLLVH